MNSHLKFYALIFFTLTCVFQLHAQFYNYGQDPGCIKWKQIESGHFKFIFPSNDSILAQKAINAFEKSYTKVSYSLKIKPKKTSVILHPKSVISNGFVVWAPKRAELFTNLSQSDLSMDNIDQLALHEFRHVAQLSKLNKGMGKILYYLLGEESVGALAGLFIPQWFLEGDAVCSETALSLSGRGRAPFFINKMKALLIEKGRYSYDKAIYGSYKDFVPDHYELGYLITAQARKVYGKDIWCDVLNNVARKPYTITPFSCGIKKVSGLRKIELYKSTLDTLKKEWVQETNQLKKTFYKPVTKKNKFYSTYYCPSPANDSSVIAFKTSLNENDKIISIDSKGKEQKILTTGYVDPLSLSHAGKMLSFIENKNDVRWENRTYSNIVTYNMVTKKIKRLTSKARYQTSVLSPDGLKIAAVYNTEEGITGMHIIDANSGKVISEIKNDSNVFFMNPSWSDDGLFITCVLHNRKGKALGLIDINKMKIKALTPFSFYEYSYPDFYKNYILYTLNLNTTDNIFALDTLTKKVFQLTSSLYGATEVKKDGIKGIIYTNLTADGIEIVYVPSDSLLWKPVAQILSVESALCLNLAKQENGIVDFNKVSDSNYVINNYHKCKHLFNFHSWAPFYLDVDQNAVNPGFVLFSQNLLSTATTSAGYKYSTIEKTGKFILGFEYAGFYPILTSNITYGKRSYAINNSDSKILTEEATISDGLRIPFTFMNGRYVRQFQFTVTSSQIFTNPKADTLKNRLINALDYGFYFYNYIKSLNKDIYPQWAQSISFRYAHTPFSGENLGKISGSKITLYFPGILRHNSFFVSSTYQKREVGVYAFNYFYALPRGFNDLADDYESIVNFSGNYALPLLYPDLTVSSLLYMKRIRALLFYDFGKTYNVNQILRSYGIELLSDVHILRFIAPIELGTRIIYNQNKAKFTLEPLFSVNFNAL